MPELLEAREIVAGYGRGPAILNGASLTIRAGQSQCIIGPNGAGKSTLLKAIAGLLPIRSGEILYKGETIDGLRADQILRKGICFVPQERALFPRMSVRENLRMGGYILADRRELEDRIETVLASPREAGLLESTTAMPMLRLHRRSLDTEGSPIEVVHALYRGDRVAFEATLTDGD